MKKLLIIPAILLTLTSCYKDDYNNLMAEYQALRESSLEELKMLQDELNAEIQENEELTAMIESLQSTQMTEETVEYIAELQTKVNEQAKTIQEITDQLAIYTNQADANDAMIDALEESLITAVANYTATVTTLQNELLAAQAEIADNDAYIDELEKTIDRLQKQVERLQRLIENFINNLGN